MSEENEKKGKIPSIVGSFKALVAEDPLLAIIVGIIIIPVGGAIATSAITAQYQNILPLLVVEAATILLCCIPLVITKVFKQNQKALNEERKKAIDTEAQKRIAIEQNKQLRFNQLMEAKIGNLKAQTDYILSQSDRQEREQLRAVVEQLREALKHANVNFVSVPACVENVHKILEELEQVQMNYDQVIDSIKIIEQGLNLAPQAEESQDDYQQLIHEQRHRIDQFTEEIEQKDKVIENLKSDINDLLRDVEGGAKQYQELQARYDKLEAKLNPPEKSIPKLYIKTSAKPEDPNLNLPNNVEALEEAMKVLDNMNDKTPDETFCPIAQGLVLANAIEEDNESVLAWECPRCGRQNDEKKVRCPACGRTKPS